MEYKGVLISVADINKARKFYEDLFGLELYQDYGINISFACGISLQQDFHWLVNIPKESVLCSTTSPKYSILKDLILLENHQIVLLQSTIQHYYFPTVGDSA